MRSLEFKDRAGRMLMLRDLSKVMGQFPYKNPSVFNFYLPDYAPDAFPDGLVGPEFQIFDTPFVIGFTQGVLAMVDNQGLTHCDTGFGVSSWGCQGGMGLLQEFGSVHDAWSQLDVLLTGGRLGSMKTRLMDLFALDDGVWVTLFETGVDNTLNDEETFNRIFQEAGSGIVRRECSGCTATHQTIFLKADNPSGFDAYNELLVRWTSSGHKRYMHLYSSLEDALQGTNEWQYCNGNSNGIGFPRDCGPTGRVNGQWSSLSRTGGQLFFKFSVLKASPPPPQENATTTVAPTPAPGPATLVQIQDAESAIVLSPHFHTLGAVRPVGKREPPPDNAGGAGGQGYKAMVVLYLFGGCDTFNMLVPLDCPRFEEYKDIRKTVQMDPLTELNRIKTAGQTCEDFGIHANLGVLKDLYDAKEAAFVTNVGNLIEPRLGRTGAQTCPGGFSHNDMQHASQTLHCAMGTNFKHGGGGRMADALATGSGKFNVNSFSLSGKAAWSEGESTRRSVISGNSIDSEGGFTPGAKVQRIIDNMTTIEFSSIYAKEYVNQFDESVNSFKKVSEALSQGDSLLQDGMADYAGLGSLKQVARLIAARDMRKAERDFFFVGYGGFDMHTGLKRGLEMRFGNMHTGISAFVAEMKAQGIWDHVVFATQSDFARTLDPNANAGSDHAWAGQHMVLSGSINGGRIYNDFPASLAAGNPADLGRGRLIPKYPYESYMVPIAKWLGVDEHQLGTVFPNLHYFNRTEHIIKGLF